MEDQFITQTNLINYLPIIQWMITKTMNVLLSSLILVLTLSFLILQQIHVDAVKFPAVPFENIPVAKIHTDNGEYKLDPAFSIDFGDEPVIEKNFNADSVMNMTLDKKMKDVSVELDCDGNDNCGTSLAPLLTRIYLVNSSEPDNVIANNNITTLEIKSNNCGNLSTQDCANFNFTIPKDIEPQNYKFVVDISFDEAKWIFVNPVKISK
jgi:hypothetical protein